MCIYACFLCVRVFISDIQSYAINTHASQITEDLICLFCFAAPIELYEFHGCPYCAKVGLNSCMFPHNTFLDSVTNIIKVYEFHCCPYCAKVGLNSCMCPHNTFLDSVTYIIKVYEFHFCPSRSKFGHNCSVSPAGFLVTSLNKHCWHQDRS